MIYSYGTAQSEIDRFFEKKKSWSKVKDQIVGNYIVCYLKTVHNLNRPIVLVDAFAGPGRFGDGSEGSPLLICKAISDHWKGHAPMSCVFADTRPAHRAALEENLAEYIKAGICKSPLKDCSEAISTAIDAFNGSTIFFYLDPYGIKDLEFDMVRQIYERNPERSTEVLINFNFRTFMRMSGNWGYSDTASEVAQKVRSEKVETVHRVMGGEYWLNIITDPSLDKIAREQAVIDAYLVRVRKYFKFAFAIPVKERDEDQQNVPVDELAHYHLIFGTRSPKAIGYMNDVGLNALEPYLSQFKDGLLFDMTPDRYQAADTALVKAAIVDAVRSRPLLRPSIYESVIPQFFMHHKKAALRQMVDELTFVEGKLFPDRRSMKRANQLNNDTLLSAQPWP